MNGQFATGMPAGNNMGGMPNMGGQSLAIHQSHYQSVQNPQMQMGMNPFMTNQMIPQNQGYVNPNHNKQLYENIGTGKDPFSDARGPSNESWAKDVNDLGFSVNIEVKKQEKDTDNVAEFKDLFTLGKGMKVPEKKERPAIDLSYNPAVLPMHKEPVFQ